jgi:formate dehydrogenase major subunit
MHGPLFFIKKSSLARIGCVEEERRPYETMKISRRGFLKLTGGSAIAVTLAKMGVGLTSCQTYLEDPILRIRDAKETPTICPYCGSGCGQIVSVDKTTGKIINIEGDPDNPINRGGNCSKGSALFQVAVNPANARLTKVLYRAPGAADWEEKDWDWAIDRIARNVKKTRDAAFTEKENDIPVNRAEALANLGGAGLDNEEGYLISKAMRALGVTWLEHQARI